MATYWWACHWGEDNSCEGNNITLTLHPANTAPVSPGSTLQFHAILSTNRPLKIISAEATFRSFANIWHYHLGMGSSTSSFLEQEVLKAQMLEQKIVSLRASDSDPDSDGIHIVDRRGRILPYDFRKKLKVHKGGSEAEVTQVTFRIRLTLPETLADTWNLYRDSLTLKIRNTLEVDVGYRVLGVRPAWTVLPGLLQLENHPAAPARTRTLKIGGKVMVRNDNMPLEIFGEHDCVVSTAKKNVGFLFCRGRIECRLATADVRVVRGDNLPLEVKIVNNSSKVLRRVTLGLYMGIKLNKEETGISWSEEQLIYHIPMPRLPASSSRECITDVTILPDVMPSNSVLPCNFVELRYFVRLTLKWWFGKLTSDVDIYVGTHTAKGIHRPHLSGVDIVSDQQ